MKGDGKEKIDLNVFTNNGNSCQSIDNILINDVYVAYITWLRNIDLKHNEDTDLQKSTYRVARHPS
jgi:hypothetical protein